jgi:putative ABC transport system permease protein
MRDGIRTGLPGSLGSATVASGLVDDLSATIGAVVPEGGNPEGAEDQILITWSVAPDYFQVVGVPVAQGRGFLEEEGSQGEEVVIINEEIARRYFPEGDAVGRRVLLADEWYRVVGVAGSVRLPEFTGSRFGDIQVYFPLAQEPSSSLNLIARVTGDRTAAVDRLKESVWRIDPGLPVLDVSLVEDALAESLSQERSNALLMVLFALTALTLGAVGMYGMVAYSVSRRVREIGVRMALGASSRDVVRRTVLGGMAPVLAGMVLGALGAFFLGSTLSGVLQVDPRDPSVYFVVGALTASVAFLATWLPARRAAGGSPIDALRAE